MKRHLLVSLVALVALAALALSGCACDGGPERTGPVTPLFADPEGVEVLVAEPSLGEPNSDGPNRFFRGWRPANVEGRAAFRSEPGGAGLQVVTLGPPATGDRTLALDLAGVGATGGHVEVRIDDRPPSLAPVSDPLVLSLPSDLPPGRHFVELRPRVPDQPPLVAFAAAVRPAPLQGAAGIEGRDLVQAGPSMVDAPARPGAGAVLTGELCPGRRFSGTGELGVELVGADDRTVARWSGSGGPGAFLGRCRRIELPPLETDDPVRVRFTALHAGAGGRWRGWHWSLPAERPGEPPAVGATPAEPPRLVVFYLLDALRADAVSHLGGAAGVTPNLDRLAREGHTFRDHRSTAPNTILSLRHLFPGHLLVNEGAWRAVGSDLPLLAEVFQKAGYRTGLFSGNGYLAGPFGLGRGFEHVSETALFEGLDSHEPGVNRNAEEVHSAALAWLDDLPAESRAFLYLHTIHPHNPYSPPAELERRFTGGIPSGIEGTTPVLRDVARGRRTTTPADRRRLRALYTASLAYNDAEIGRLLAALRERFDDREILLVVTSDHGEELFDHGGVLHGYTLYEELLRIPLVLWAPERIPPGETAGVTDALDLHATLIDLLGDDAEGVETEGRSLLGLLQGRTGAPEPRLHFAAADGPPGGAFSVRWGRWKYVWVRGNRRTWAMGLGPARSWDREYFFDLAADPEETENLAGTGGVRERWLRARLRTWVAERLAQAHGGGEAPPPPALDEATERRLRALGYLD